MGGQREPVEPVVRPVTGTDMLLAQIVGLLGEIRDCLPEQVPPKRINLGDATFADLVTEPAKPVKPVRKKPAPKKDTGE